MSDHVKDSEIEAFAIGALDAAASDAFVAHVAQCDACSARLAAEAQRELAFGEVAAERHAQVSDVSKTRPSNVRRLRTPALTAGLALAAAAALVLAARSDRAAREVARGNAAAARTVALASTAPIAPVICPAGPEQMQCVQHAHKRGLYVKEPHWAGAPALGGRRAADGPADSPFLFVQR